LPVRGGWRRVELLALTDQRVVALAERREPPGRELGLAGCLRELDRDVQFDEQLRKPGEPRLAGELGDPGQLAQVAGVARAVLNLLVLAVDLGTPGTDGSTTKNTCLRGKSQYGQVKRPAP